MAQYVGTNSRSPFYSAGWTDSRNPASGARNHFIEVDPGNPFAQGVPSVGGGSRDPTGMSHADKLNNNRGQHLDEAYYNAQMDFLGNMPEWANVSQQNQPYYFNQMGVTNQANAARDAALGTASSNQTVGLANAGSTRDVGLASAAAQQDLAQAQLDAAVKQAQINTGAAERISSGRNQILGPLLESLGGAYGTLANQLPGAIGGLAGQIGGWMGGGGNSQNQPLAGLQDPYRKYRDQIAGREQGQPNNLLAALRGSL